MISQNNSPSLILSALASLVMVTTGVPAASAADRVLLVSWDGVQKEAMEELLHWQPSLEAPLQCPQRRHQPRMPQLCGLELTCMPNLCNFQLVNSQAAEGKPLTKPQHAQMLSGYGPAETGEIANAGKGKLPPGWSIYERIRAIRPDVKLAHIAGRKFVSRGIIKFARKAGVLDVDMRRGGYDRFSGNNTTARFVQAMDIIGPDDPFFMFIHYKTADVVAHRAGSDSEQYYEAIHQMDFQLGEILKDLEVRGIRSLTHVYVTTDHGFEGIFHLNNKSPLVTDTWIAASEYNLNSAAAATVLDITPTILADLAVPTGGMDPQFRGRSLMVAPHR